MRRVFLICIILVFWCQGIAQTIVIDGNARGEVFEGVGAVSAGASSRLLIDYPEPFRGDILDYLFKPMFGAGLQHLKVEIGGDINSTTGTEPSHARTRDELMHPRKGFYQRGYEYWLMSEAKKRNIDMIFDCLQWGAPGWFTGGFFSQDNADYIVAFIRGARKYHGLDIRFAGTWNEKASGAKRDWIVNVLRPTLDRNGLAHVGIVADDWHGSKWDFAKVVVGDTTLRNSLYALGYHYVNSTTTDTARMTGLRLWESEAWSKSGEWPNAIMLARQINRNYVKGRITKTLIWNPVDAYYDNVSWSGIGAMTASEPWSGHYVVKPAVWAIAHTTQFTKPGWVYLDSGCDSTTNHTYFVTMMDPRTTEYSIIVTTGKVDETLHFRLAGLPVKALHVWKSDSLRQFVQIEDILPDDGAFSVSLSANAIYSITTTRGQQKGEPSQAIPARQSFPRDYREDFEDYKRGKTPRYFSDQGGAFEVYRAKGESKTLRQVITNDLIVWDTWGPNDPEPFTEFGDFFSDYEVSSDVLIEGKGTVKIMGRAKYFESNKGVHGYTLAVDDCGEWRLMKFLTTIVSGTVPFSADTWHSLKLQFEGNMIRVYIDGKEVAAVRDSTYAKGYAGVGSGWNHARFDNIRLKVK